MTKLQLPFLHLRHINNQHTWAYSVLQHIQTFLKKKNNHINIIIPTCLFPPQLKKLTNCHYMTPQLYQLDDLFPKFWDVKVSGGMIYFLTRFKTISNDSKLTVTLKLGKSCLGRGEDIPLDYRKECLEVYNALLWILYMYSARFDWLISMCILFLSLTFVIFKYSIKSTPNFILSQLLFNNLHHCISQCGED